MDTSIPNFPQNGVLQGYQMLPPHPNMYGNIPIVPQIPVNPQMPILMNIPINPLMNQIPQKPLYESTKVWVSKIPENISDTFMLKLLEACGTVTSWKRVEDVNGKPKSFGICEYENVEGLLKSIRLLNNYPLEGSKLQVKVSSETEEFLTQWREDKKQEYLESLRMHGIPININEIKRKEKAGEPLEWELQLISKDNETFQIINDLVSKRGEIEAIAKQNEKSDLFLKNLKELATGSLSTHFESNRERERQKKKNEKLKKLEKAFKKEERKWEKHEEEREKEKQRDKEQKEYLEKKIKKFIEIDLNYDSEEEKHKISLNPKKYEEREIMRIKEKEYDDEMRKKDNGLLFKEENEYGEEMNNNYTGLVCLPKEPEAKTKLEVQEMEINTNNNNNEEGNNNNKDKSEGIEIVNLEIKNPNQKINIHKLDEDEDDLYTKKNNMNHIELNPETENALLNIPMELKKYEKKKKYNFEQMLKGIPKGKYLNIQKEIIAHMPTKQEDILNYNINWSVVNDYQIKKLKIKPWLEKNLLEYFDDVESFSNFLLEKIGVNSSTEILDMVKHVLENDAEAFVSKLWKNIIFETMKVEKVIEEYTKDDK